MTETQDITEVITAVKELCRVGICYYDLDRFFQYERFGVRENRGHYCAFCRMARELKNGKLRCERSDRLESVSLAMQYREPFFFECHMGMRELVVPLFSGDSLIGVLFVGQCRIDGEEREKAVRRGARQAGGSEEEFAALYRALPMVKQEVLLHAGKILSRYFAAKIVNSELLSSGRTSAEEGRGLVTGVKSYVEQHYRASITPSSVARAFYVNPSYLSRCFRKECGITLTEYIQGVRVRHGATLLRSTAATVGSVAMNVGFGDAGYFSRVFTRVMGVSPKTYREEGSALNLPSAPLAEQK